MISIYFYCWWVFNLPLLAPLPTYPHEVVKGPHFEARPEPEITSPNPARARYLFLKPDLSLKAKFTEEGKICATAEQQKTCAGVVAGTRFITENSNHPDQNIDII